MIFDNHYCLSSVFDNHRYLSLSGKHQLPNSLKYSKRNNCSTCPKNGTVCFYNAVMLLKHEHGMANNVHSIRLQSDLSVSVLRILSAMVVA